MAPRLIKPKRPDPLERRAYFTPLTLAEIADRLTQHTFTANGLRDLCLYAKSDRRLTLTSPKLRGNMHFSLAREADPKTPRNHLKIYVDYRRADTELFQEVRSLFGSHWEEQRLRRPVAIYAILRINGYHESMGHFLAWSWNKPGLSEHIILDSAIESGLECDFRGGLIDCLMTGYAMHDPSELPSPKEGQPYTCESIQNKMEYRRTNVPPREAIRTFFQGEKITLDRYIDTCSDKHKLRMRIHYTWHPALRRYLIGWVADTPGISSTR